jgi:hypothetical protein
VTVGLTPAKVWSPDQQKFQAWLALPSAARQPRSQRALAAELELHEITLSEWKRLPGFGAAVCALAFDVVKHELPAVLHAQVREAKAGSLEHAKFLFEVTGLWSSKTINEHQGEGGGPLKIVIETVADRAAPPTIRDVGDDRALNGASA